MSAAMADHGGVLVGTKLHVPRARAGTVARPRLIERFPRHALPPLTLVSAPAGFGKTTLAVAWLGDDACVGWVALDRRDSDPRTFWAYVAAALDRVEPGVAAGTAAALQAGAAVEAVVATLINDVDALDAELVLVLDDYHVLDGPEVHDSVAFLLEHLPPQLRLVVLTRSDPPLPLASLRARGDLVELRAADLRFTPDEVAAYLDEAAGPGLAPEDVARLEARTEGWIAALQLAALSLRGRDDAREFVAGFSGDDRFVLDYLVGEVLDRQTDDVRRFLLDTSVLTRLSGDLCDAVTGGSGGRAVLEQLDRANLFLVPLDDRRRWYRYHHLFADVLRAWVQHEEPDRVPVLHRRASAWLAAHEQVDEAVGHALAAGDHEGAANLVEVAAPALRRQRREGELRTWLEALPEAVLTDRPTLAVQLAGTRMATGDGTGCAALLDLAEARLGREPAPIVVDAHATARVPAELAMYRAGLALLADDVDGTIEHASAALARFAPDDRYGRGAVAALRALARWRTGDLAAAQSGYEDAIDCFVASGHAADVLGCSVTLADLQLAQGRLGDATRTYERGLRLSEEHGGLRGVVDMHVGLAEVALERHDLELATAHLRAAADAGDGAGLPQSAYRRRLEAARLQQSLGDLDGALALLDDAAARYATDFSPAVRPVAAWRARLRLARGEVQEALAWMADRRLEPDDALTYPTEFEHLTAGRVLAAAGRPDVAVRLLERVAAAASAGGRVAHHLDALVALAVAHAAAGEEDAAAEVAKSALEQAGPLGTLLPLLEVPPDLLRAVDPGSAAGRHAADVLTAAVSADESSRPPTRTGLVDELSPRELDVLQLLRTDLGGPAIARHLHVSLNTFRTHTKRIYMKLGATNRREALTRAAELGL